MTTIFLFHADSAHRFNVRKEKKNFSAMCISLDSYLKNEKKRTIQPTFSLLHCISAHNLRYSHLCQVIFLLIKNFISICA